MSPTRSASNLVSFWYKEGLYQRMYIHLQANASSTGDIRWQSLKSLCYCVCWECSESFIRSWFLIEDIKNKHIKWLEELKQMLPHIVSSRTLQEAVKVGALSWKNCASTYSIFGWMGFKRTHLWRQKTLLQLFIVYAVPVDGIWDIARYTLPFALGTKQKNHIPNWSKSYGRQRNYKKYLQILQGFLTLVNQPGLN